MHDDHSRWHGLFRGSVLSAMFTKHIAYVTSADTRAQGLMMLSAALVPLAISGMQHAPLRLAATISALTALLTIICCVFSLYPKRFKPKSGTQNLFHYVEFQQMNEAQFIEEMEKIIVDKEALTRHALRDLHHLGSSIIHPKYFFLRLAYGVFLVGQSIATLMALRAGTQL